MEFGTVVHSTYEQRHSGNTLRFLTCVALVSCSRFGNSQVEEEERIEHYCVALLHPNMPSFNVAIRGGGKVTRQGKLKVDDPATVGALRELIRQDHSTGYAGEEILIFQHDSTDPLEMDDANLSPDLTYHVLRNSKGSRWICIEQ